MVGPQGYAGSGLKSRHWRVFRAARTPALVAPDRSAAARDSIFPTDALTALYPATA